MIVGIVGGIAPESTVEYYRSIIRRYRERTGSTSYPRIVINSIDLEEMLRLVAAGDRNALTDYLLHQVRMLERAGADFGFFASNTPHIVFEEVERQSAIPLISIVRTACASALALGVRRAGLLGTRYTMESAFYPETFKASGIEILIPSEADRTWVHERYMNELVAGSFRDETRKGLLQVISRMHAPGGLDAVILGGTELPLILTSDIPTPVPLIDTTRSHVEAVVERMIAA
ncbi:MAG: amino acid racemase [Thermoanaerobaculia bacterium]|nr:amino acid racemase [Thermoanaerobaculia bacterium]